MPTVSTLLGYDILLNLILLRFLCWFLQVASFFFKWGPSIAADSASVCSPLLSVILSPVKSLSLHVFTVLPVNRWYLCFYQHSTVFSNSGFPGVCGWQPNQPNQNSLLWEPVPYESGCLLVCVLAQDKHKRIELKGLICWGRDTLQR